MKKLENYKSIFDSFYNKLHELNQSNDSRLIEEKVPYIVQEFKRTKKDFDELYEEAYNKDDGEIVRKWVDINHMYVSGVEDEIEDLKEGYFNYDPMREMRIMFPNGMADPDDNESWFDDEDF